MQLKNTISLTTRKTFQSDVNAGQLKDPDGVEVNNYRPTVHIFQKYMGNSTVLAANAT